MNRIALLSGVVAVFGLATGAVAADPPKPAAKAAYKAPRTTNGQPDLQGNWSNASLTTLERNATYGERLVLDKAEVAKLEGDEAKARDAGNAPTDPSLKISDLPVDCGRGFTGTNCGYNSGWVDPGSTVMRVNGEARSSFITSTKNGRVPPNKQGVAFSGRGAGLRPGMAQNDNPETRSLGERCLMSFGQSTGPVMLPQLYNNTYQFVQSKDALAISVEMVHDTRVVRLNVPHRTDGVRPWMGDSIGHWEGDTLVVETTNFPRQQALRGVSWENLKVTEKFTRVADDRLKYEFKVEDPTVWDTAWGGEYEFAKSNGGVYEYACHEGNYALEGILAGARNDEAIAAAKAAGTHVEGNAPTGRSDR